MSKIKNFTIFLLVFYFFLFSTNFFMSSIFPRIKALLNNNSDDDNISYSYQNFYTHEREPINIQKEYPPQRTSFYSEDDKRNNVHIGFGPGGHYPNRINLIKSLNFYPLSGLSNQKISVCNENGYWPVIKNDKYGNNNKIEINEAELIFFGDSFGEATCVNQNDSIQATMTNVGMPTYSFSNGGISLLASYASFVEHIELAKNTKKVVYLYYLNDTGNKSGQSLMTEINNPHLSKYLKDGYRQPNYIKNYLSSVNQSKMKNYSETKIIETSNLSWRTANADKPPMTYRLLRLIKLNWYKDMLYKTKLINFDKDEKKYIEILLYRMKTKSESLGKEFLVTSIPVCKDRYGNLPKTKKNEGKKVKQGLANDVKNIALKLNIKIIDLSSAFSNCDEYNKRRPNIMNTPSGVHFDEKGYRMIGEELFRLIKKTN